MKSCDFKGAEMLTLKLTPAQRSAVGTYITESVHEDDYPDPPRFDPDVQQHLRACC